MRRLLWLPLILAVACTPAQQQLAREGAVAALQCAGLRGARQIEPTVADILDSEGNWQQDLAVLGARVTADAVQCAVASIFRSLGAQHKASADGLQMQTLAPPLTTKQRAAVRAQRWLQQQDREARL